MADILITKLLNNSAKSSHDYIMNHIIINCHCFKFFSANILPQFYTVIAMSASKISAEFYHAIPII